MKKIILLSLAAVFSMLFIFWGKTGHKTVGLIAQRHLTAKAAMAIHDLIGDTSLADISTYADEIRGRREYKYTSPWHYINLEPGLGFDDFQKAVEAQTHENVYNILGRLENDLINPSKSKAEKVFALKLIVHFIGDLHQPMHVSRAEDQGGNTIKITFNGNDGNLHGLWDSDFIDHQGLSYEQLAAKYDHASKVQIDMWQHDKLIKWLFESYQISTKLYKDAAENSNFNEEYYQRQLPVIADRLEKAGIRLAGVLNEAFSGGPYSIIPPPSIVKLIRADALPKSSSVPVTPLLVASNDVAHHIDETITTTGRVVTTRLISSNNMTLLNVGAPFPNQDFTIMIRSENREKFGQPDVDLKGKTVTVTGVVIDYKGKPEIEITDAKQLTVASN